MCHENHQLEYKRRQMKNAEKIHLTWFWNNVIDVDNLDDSISNTYF